MKTILVIGGSRGIGLETVRVGLERGHHVRVLARSARDIDLGSENLLKLTGSALDRAAVDEALTGVDAVIMVLGMAPTRSEVTLFSEATKVLLNAMQDSIVRRLIAVTGIGAGNSAGVGGFLYSRLFHPVFLKKIYEDKNRQEDLIAQSDVDWTILRPGFLTRLPRKGRYELLTDPRDWKGGFISRKDVGACLIDLVESGACVRQTPLVIS